eukprot:480991-Prorocentrum_lima.AAC.1
MDEALSSGIVVQGSQSTDPVEVTSTHYGRDPASSARSPRPNTPDLRLHFGVSEYFRPLQDDRAHMAD